MKNKTRIITIGGTFLCALGIGFFMQNTVGDAPAPVEEPVARADFKPLSEPVLDALRQPEDAGSAAPVDVQTVVPVEIHAFDADTPAPGIDVAGLGDVVAPEPQPAPVVETPACGVTASAEVLAGAMVDLSVSAPCLLNERATVHHNGMMFTAATDDAGQFAVSVPALAENAIIIVEFANGDGAIAEVQVTSLQFYDRVVLQWTGDTGFQLHAREFGAEYGSDGHVWVGAPRDVTAAAMGEGGFVTRLGAPDTLAPRMAEIYSFPSGTAARGGDVLLSVEAEVTADNCGQDIEAQALEVQHQGRLRTQYLTLAVLDCSAIGDFLVLNNLVDDLKIAGN